MATGDGKIIYTGPSPRGWHRLQLAAECLQKYAWRYEGPEKPKEAPSPALAKGSLVHLALAQRYATMRAEQRAERGEEDDPADWCDPFTAVDLIARMEGTEKFTQNVLDTYEAYCRMYAYEHEKQTMQIIAVEDLVSTKIRGKYLLTGRLDLAYKDLGGRIWVVDHKCLPASTSVLTPEGPVTVGELVEAGKDWTCGAWDEQHQRTIWARALAPVDAGVQDVYSIALADGTSERFGYRHPLLTDAGWRQAKDVQEGDWIAVAAPPDLPDQAIPDGVLRLLGLALSDGGRVEDDASYVITAHDAGIRAYMTEALDELGDSWSEHKHKEVVQGIRLHKGGRARVFIEAKGIHTKLAVDKTFPRELLGLSSRQAGILLGSLWEGDGAAYLGTPAKKSGKRPVRIMFSSRSRSLCEGVRHLLLQLGVLSNVIETKAAGSPYFQTVVVGRDNKQQFLQLAVKGRIDAPVSCAGGRRTRSGRVLESFGELLTVLRESEPKGTDMRIRKPGQGRQRNPKLEEGIRWVKVTSTLFVGRECCYDIEVPGPHTFLTGHCVVTHNTTGRLTSRHKVFYGMSGQMHAYLHMARETYTNVAGLKLNMIQHKNFSNGADPKFERFDLMRSSFLESKFEQSIVDIEERIERMLETGRAYDDGPKAMSELTCFHRYGTCEFLDQCRHGAGAKKGGNWTWSKH